MANDRPKRPRHPKLTEKEAQRQRGEDPAHVVGDVPEHPHDPDPDPNFVPDPHRADLWRGMMKEISREHRPRREDVYPYLLVRAFSPGDRGQRPLWQPIVCWESPDILLIDASFSGPFDSSRLVLSPTAGRAYRVFVRAWNLGLFPATGVHVRAWAIAPGFFGNGNQDDPYYQQHHIGGAWIPQLTDRRGPGCVSVVEMDAPWKIPSGDSGHHCLIASVTCPLDHFDGPLHANDHRHVGQRNLEILSAGQSAQPLMSTLAGLVPKGFTLELTHGGPAAVPLLQALGGGAMQTGDGRKRGRIIAPALDQIRGGVNIGTSVHLLTAFSDNGRTLVARSASLQKLVGRTRLGRAPVAAAGARGVGMDAGIHPFAVAGGSRRLLERLGPNRWADIGEVTDLPLAEALPQALMHLLDLPGLDAAGMAKALGGSPRAQHLLRLTLSTPEGELVGGYSIVVGQ